MLIDAHAHLDKYDPEQTETVIAELQRLQILTVATAMDIASYEKILALANCSELVIPAFGIHPWNAPEYASKLDLLDRFVADCPLIGEIGLDFHFVKDEGQYSAQKSVFEYFLSAARSKNKLVNIHTKGAEKEIYEYLKNSAIPGVIIHWYSGPIKILKKLITLGVYFTVGVEVMQSQKIREIAALIPLEQLLSETDNPGGYKWLKAEPGMPDLLPAVLSELSEIRGQTKNFIAETIFANFRRLTAGDAGFLPWSKYLASLSLFLISLVLQIGFAGPASAELEFGVCCSFEQPASSASRKKLEELAKSGLLWIRGDMRKSAQSSSFLKDMKSANLKVLGLLPWYKKSALGWKDYVGEVVNASPALDAYEISNEPEMTWWGGPITSSDYIQMLKEAIAIIKKKNPDAIIVGPAVSATKDGVKYLDELIQKDLLKYVDAVSVHYYVFYDSTQLDGIKKLLAGRKPLWITETGWTTVDQAGAEKAQTAYLHKYYDLKSGILGSDPSVSKLFHFDLADKKFPSDKGKKDGWGLLYGPESSYKPKAAYAEFKSLLKSGQ